MDSWEDCRKDWTQVKQVCEISRNLEAKCWTCSCVVINLFVMCFLNTPKSCTLHLQLVIYFTLYRNYAVNSMTKLLLALRFLATGYFFICAGDSMGVSKTSTHDFNKWCWMQLWNWDQNLFTFLPHLKKFVKLWESFTPLHYFQGW